MYYIKADWNNFKIISYTVWKEGKGNSVYPYNNDPKLIKGGFSNSDLATEYIWSICPSQGSVDIFDSIYDT
tara:strand:+ start:399 stop:611 length:213 start_codon:yes stop_codon:yes gene_type:complete